MWAGPDSVPAVIEDLAVDWAVSARPQHVDDEIEVSAPVEIGLWRPSWSTGRTSASRCPFASTSWRIVPARRARSISSAVTATSSSCSASACIQICSPALASAYWTAASLAAVCRVTTQESLDHGERLAVLLERLACSVGEQPELLADELDQQCLFGGEVAVDGADTDAGVPGDIVDLRVRAGLREHDPRALEDPLAIAAGVGAQRAISFDQRRSGHSIFTRLA